MAHEPIRVLCARQHATIYPGLGVFLAGPTAGTGWRRTVIARLAADERLAPPMTIQEFLRNTRRRSFVVGGPEDAEAVKWAQRMAVVNGVPWHHDLDAVAQAIAECLLREPRGGKLRACPTPC